MAPLFVLRYISFEELSIRRDTRSTCLLPIDIACLETNKGDASNYQLNCETMEQFSCSAPLTLVRQEGAAAVSPPCLRKILPLRWLQLARREFLLFAFFLPIINRPLNTRLTVHSIALLP